MSTLRQVPSASVFDPRDLKGAAISTISHQYAAKHHVENHFHERAQLLYAASGVMTVSTCDGVWVIPPERAVWIPDRVEHSILMHSAVLMKSIYARRGLLPGMPAECSVINVSPLLRELLIRACEVPGLYPKKKRDASFLKVLTNEIRDSSLLPLRLSLPRDSRALSIAQRLIASPRSSDNMEALLKSVGLSRRTLERIYKRETGISFGHWRQQLSVVHAVRLLGQGVKVTVVAEECGYNSASAFVVMFRKRLGITPARYLIGVDRRRSG